VRHNPGMSDMPVSLSYDRGTVLVTGGPPGFVFSTLPGVVFDPRTSTAPRGDITARLWNN
jgi:hypothetical protein